MSLQVIKIIDKLIPNRRYAASIGVPPLNKVLFFYEPSTDVLVLIGLGVVGGGPYGAIVRWLFNAETGECLDESGYLADPDNQTSLLAYHWSNGISNGPDEAIYRTEASSGLRICSVPWTTLWPKDNMLQVDCSNWTDPNGFQFGFCTGDPEMAPENAPLYLVVVTQDSWTLKIYDFRNAQWKSEPYIDPILRGQLILPGVLSSISAENSECGWLITNKGIVAKFNWARIPPRWEMISSVQDPTMDAIGYNMAFDTNRKRVVVFRRRSDSGDPEAEYICRCQLEFYRPLSMAVGITDPVPISPLRCGEKVRFISHIYGDAGEGIATYLSQVETLPGGAGGTILSPQAPAEINGAVLMRYHAPDIPGEDTIKISATIPNGETS